MIVVVSWVLGNVWVGHVCILPLGRHQERRNMTGVDCGLGAVIESGRDAVGLVMNYVAETGSKCDQVAGRCTLGAEG